ncbi:MAG: reverse transcriptase family protein [Rivularia sp. (in: cyanobacteria)]
MPKNSYTGGYELNQSPFYCLKSKFKLSKLLHVGKSKLKILTKSEDLYREEKITGKNGKSRPVQKPRPDLKKVQKRVEKLLKRIKIPIYIHAPAKGISHINNAQAHINAAVVRTLDIEKYFASTPSRHVYSFFHKWLKCSPDVAAVLTKILTFKGSLPTGSPSSPIISYFSHIKMWESINEIVNHYNCNLTVYMDDVTISGDCVPDQLIWQIKQQFYRCGLRSNDKKEKCYIRKNSYEITGIIVTEKGELKIPNRQHKKMYKIRQALRLETEPKKRQKLIQSLKGLKAYERQITMVKSA